MSKVILEQAAPSSLVAHLGLLIAAAHKIVQPYLPGDTNVQAHLLEDSLSPQHSPFSRFYRATAMLSAVYAVVV